MYHGSDILPASQCVCMYPSVYLTMLCTTPLSLHVASELCRSPSVCRGKTEVGEQMEACVCVVGLGGVIGIWGTLCGGGGGGIILL